MPVAVILEPEMVIVVPELDTPDVAEAHAAAEVNDETRGPTPLPSL